MAEGEINKAGKPGLDILTEQAYRKYQRASVSGNEAERDDALKEMVSLLADQVTLGTLTGEELAKLQKIAPTLVGKAADLKVALRNQANEKSVDLRQKISDSDRQLLEKESKDVFDMLKSGFQPSIGLLGTLKSFALLFKAFGVDTSELVARCDDLIMEEKAKFRHNNPMDHDNVYRAKTGIKTTDLETSMDITQQKATAEVRDHASEIRDLTVGIADRMKPQAKATPKAEAKSAEVQTSRFVDAAKEITAKDGKDSIAAKVSLDKMVKMASNGDGNAATMSAQEVGTLETMVTKSLSSKKVENAADEAHKLIERVRARANEPAPQPS